MKNNNVRIQKLLASFPRARSLLPAKYREVYEREYQLNRGGGSFLTRIAAALEAWMHRKVAIGSSGHACVLELGAGNLNHLVYEKSYSGYDVVEPFKALYEDRAEIEKVRHFYDSIDDVPLENRYQRVISIAVLEHLESLPAIVAKSACLLTEDGVFQAGIPSEGGALWGIAWRFSTGIGFWLRNRLPYGVLMRHEHVNDADEIEAVLRYFFSDVSVCRYPLTLLHLSFYSYLEARRPRLARVNEYLSSGEVCSD